ncbi:Eco57I restriction-modification methylase domain-containing protein [Prolixibacter sp. NT017]|uniref:Eco57I restriction-modification methylase domain-containing protein n=1 Tax=Prolixibacter sp. NT017 TaxID=2652390 RepID=UPI0012796A91|nr:Eco57I restriction-modification methylase domain-containing protein [Prolixibacter sp. NT017]GET25654.1 restriction endonuclease subunit M [Prolixibacter sp. NT017]
MDKQQLQKLLQKKYSRDEWNSLLSDIFPSVNLLKEPEKIEVSNKNVKSFHQTGLVRLKDGKNLAVFEVILDDGINLLRNRVALRNLTTRYIDEANNHGVLVVYDQGKENYRFTFVSQESGFNEKGEWATFETASKRFTYLLGEGESCRTASERLALLASKKTSAGLSDVIDAFSVEQLSKEFFSKYKAHYQIFVDYLSGSNFKKSMFSGNDKVIRDFVKKMLGRIVFLYFLQKKGWLGASDENYSDGDKSFMQTFWETSEKSEIFYSQHLTRLFFKGLNATSREKDTFVMPDGKKVKIPYLNGGLFEKDKNEPELLTFPPNLFNSLFSFFAEYNFTIDENDPEEHEVGIDPEMLGHIFENLLEGNRDKGAFYTPKEIVKYMTQESLVEYLKTGLEKKNQGLSYDESNALKYFVRYKLKGDEIPREDLKEDIARFYQNQLRFVQTYGSQVNKLLDNVKICDPAIGSGAFPMGLLNEIYHCKLILNSTYSLEERARVKRHIIENSIYGVDIEKGAVDIARLRFWLSLIVDEEKPSPLPNLDYKIVPGDSLISKYKDQVIKVNWLVEEGQQQSIWGNENEIELKKLLTDLSTLEKKYFSECIESKSNIKSEIKNRKIDILVSQLELMIEKEGIKEEPLKTNFKNKTRYNSAIEKWLTTKGWGKTIQELKGLKNNPEKPLNYFDWTLDFPEVLNPVLAGDNKGFDIVIGNPPYIQLQKGGGCLGELYKPMNFETYERTGDIYALFYESGIKLLKNKGILCFITSNKWMRAGYGKSLRNFFTKKNPIRLLDLGAGIFNTATVDTNILLIENSNPKRDTKAITVTKGTKLLQLTESDFINFKNLTEESWVILSPIEQSIKEKIERIGTPLKDWDININRGILTGYNEAFIIDGATKERLIKEDPKSAEIIRPILRGRDIKDIV